MGLPGKRFQSRHLVEVRVPGHSRDPEVVVRGGPKESGDLGERLFWANRSPCSKTQFTAYYPRHKDTGNLSNPHGQRLAAPKVRNHDAGVHQDTRQPGSSICSQPSSTAFSMASASSAERLPKVWARIIWRSSSLIRLSRWTKSAATYSLAGGSDLRSSTMFSSGLRFTKVHRLDFADNGGAVTC
jgi:hypothetical protein